MNAQLKFLSIAFFLIFFSDNTHADLTSAVSRISEVMGTQAILNAIPLCDITTMTTRPSGGRGTGQLSIPNSVFCVNNSLQITTPIPAPGRTFSTLLGSTTLNLHFILNPNVTVAGTTYDWEAQIWGCNTNCTQASSYFPTIYVVWTSDSTRNFGVLVNNFGAVGGATNTTQGTLQMTWNTGASTTNKFINYTMIDISSSPNISSADTLITHVQDNYTISETIGQWDGSTASGSRTNIAFNSSSNIGAYYEDSSGTTSSDTPASNGAGCFNRTASGEDYTYASTSCPSTPITMGTFGSKTLNQVKLMAQNSSTTIDSTLGDSTLNQIAGTALNGMAAHPTALITCAIGTYVSGSNCIACAPGTYNAKMNASACTSCPVGTYSAYVGASSNLCTRCPAGETTSWPGSSSINDCH